MTIFDLLLIVSVLASLIVFAITAVQAFRGRGRRALRTLTIWVIFAACYLATGLIVSAVRPQRILAKGEAWCFDDWCLTAVSAHSTPTADGRTITVALRIESRARGITQRAAGAWIYLIDSSSHRYSPDPDPAATPLDVQLSAGQSIETNRTFHLPADARGLGLITGHGGPYCGTMDVLVIGSAGCLFHKPTMIRIE